MHKWVHCCNEATSHKLPTAAAFWNHLNSFHREMFRLNAKFNAGSLLYSVILNVMATQYTRSFNDI